MNRQDKQHAVETLKNEFQDNNGSFIVGIKSLTVDQLQSLRRGLAVNGGKIKVVKNTLMEIAAKDIPGVQDMAPYFKGQVAIVFAKKEVAPVAKLLCDTAKNNENLVLVAGCFESRVFNKSGIEFVSALPPKEVLIAQVLGGCKAPISGLAGVLNGLITKMVYTLSQVAEKKQVNS